MAMRRRANTRRDKRQFTRHAVKVHKKNLLSGPMRGGIRL